VLGVTHGLHDQPDLSRFALRLGAFTATLAQGADQMAAVQRLRAARFRNRSASGDLDRFDALCHHLMIRCPPDPAAIAVARLRILTAPEDIHTSYSAQFYDLNALAQAGQRLVEVGRVCIDTAYAQDVDVARALLAAMTRITALCGADMLVGCASFAGAAPQRHADALRFLFDRHIGPVALRPGKHAGLDHFCPTDEHRPRLADLRDVPALLRMYLGMGGWVSDHAVCDHDLDTVHVFTALEVRAIPPARLRALLALAQNDAPAPSLKT
jgi:L-ornithine Nalpha-acyltransferase